MHSLFLLSGTLPVSFGQSQNPDTRQSYEPKQEKTREKAGKIKEKLQIGIAILKVFLYNAEWKIKNYIK